MRPPPPGARTTALLLAAIVASSVSMALAQPAPPPAVVTVAPGRGMAEAPAASSVGGPGPIARAFEHAVEAAINRLALGARPGQSGDPGTPTQDQAGQAPSANAFNPAISLIPDIAYYTDSEGGEGVGLTKRADGFGLGDGAAEGHSHAGDLSRGFNLRELEVALSGSVDPYFDAVANLVVAGGSIEAEELYVRTRRFPAGLQLKAGRFLSDIGYINRQHPHQWAMADQNLAYDLLLDGGIGDTGVQLTWLPALPVYLQVGAEALQGDNAAMAASIGRDAEHPRFSEKSGPRLLTLFTKVSPDLGFDHALQLGASLARSRLHQEQAGEVSVEGPAWLLGLDAVYKYDSPRPAGVGDIVVQGEYLRRTKRLTVVDGPHAEAIGDPWRSTQDGIYLQGSYGIAPRWTAALRLDAAGMANRLESGSQRLADDGTSRRLSGALTFDPTEFSRLRFQVERASIPVGGERQSFTQLFVQLQISLGVHGAHKF